MYKVTVIILNTSFYIPKSVFFRKSIRSLNYVHVVTSPVLCILLVKNAPIVKFRLATNLVK